MAFSCFTAPHAVFDHLNIIKKNIGPINLHGDTGPAGRCKNSAPVGIFAEKGRFE